MQSQSSLRQIRKKTSQDFKTKKKATSRGNICFNQILARKAQQSGSCQSPAGVAGIGLLALVSSLPRARQGKGLPAEEPG